MKIILISLLFISSLCNAQLHDEGITKYGDTTYSYDRAKPVQDTISCVMLILNMELINGKWDNKPYGLKGYRVTGDYETYYLDISKKRLPKNIIVWLDQNL